MGADAKIDGVIVLYKPDIKLLSRVIQSVEGQLRSLYLIDNSPESIEGHIFFNNSHIRYLYLGGNKGIAKAQNEGLKLATQNNADYVLLSDQDTVYPQRFVADMLCNSETDQDDIAAIVPQFSDLNQAGLAQGFIVPGLFGGKKVNKFDGLSVVNVFQAIASGTIIKTSRLHEIGLMAESLFIDWVDLEWCWRARACGFRVIGRPNVIISHTLGDKVKQLGFRSATLRTPLRHYYITRNAFHLALRCSSLTHLQRVVLFLRSFRYIVAFPLLSKPRLGNLKMVFEGLKDAIIGRLGKYD